MLVKADSKGERPPEVFKYRLELCLHPLPPLYPPLPPISRLSTVAVWDATFQKKKDCKPGGNAQLAAGLLIVAWSS